MTTKDKALKQALDWMTKTYVEICRVDDLRFNDLLNLAPAIIENVSKTLAQPEQEPVEFLVEAECKKCGAKETGIAKLKAQQPTPAAPHGWKLVPVEPLNALLSSVAGDCYMGKEWEEDSVAEIRAMLAAAPQAPAVQPLTDEQIAVIAAGCGGLASDFVISVSRAIEAAHGIK